MALLATAAAPALANDAAKKNLLIGATAGSITTCCKRHSASAAEKGYQIKLIEFNDYVQPNLALSDGSLDANFFQHRAYFDQFTTDRKLALSVIAQGPVAPMGVYSKSTSPWPISRAAPRWLCPMTPATWRVHCWCCSRPALSRSRKG